MKSPSIEKEGAIAEGNLSFLADLGYDKLGQNTINKIVESLNREHPNVGETQLYRSFPEKNSQNHKNKRFFLQRHDSWEV